MRNQLLCDTSWGSTADALKNPRAASQCDVAWRLGINRGQIVDNPLERLAGSEPHRTPVARCLARGRFSHTDASLVAVRRAASHFLPLDYPRQRGSPMK
jgi:hypothetical protein